jgi:putative redox protein
VRYAAGGPGLRREQVEKAVALSVEKYCPVSAMLRKTADMTYDVEMPAEAGGA